MQAVTPSPAHRPSSQSALWSFCTSVSHEEGKSRKRGYQVGQWVRSQLAKPLHGDCQTFPSTALCRPGRAAVTARQETQHAPWPCWLSFRHRHTISLSLSLSLSLSPSLSHTHTRTHTHTNTNTHTHTHKHTHTHASHNHARYYLRNLHQDQNTKTRFVLFLH